MGDISPQCHVGKARESDGNRTSYSSIGMRDRLTRYKTDIRIEIILILSINDSVIDEDKSIEYGADMRGNK